MSPAATYIILPVLQRRPGHRVRAPPRLLSSPRSQPPIISSARHSDRRREGLGREQTAPSPRSLRTQHCCCAVAWCGPRGADRTSHVSRRGFAICLGGAAGRSGSTYTCIASTMYIRPVRVRVRVRVFGVGLVFGLGLELDGCLAALGLSCSASATYRLHSMLAPFPTCSGTSDHAIVGTN